MAPGAASSSSRLLRLALATGAATIGALSFSLLLGVSTASADEGESRSGSLAGIVGSALGDVTQPVGDLLTEVTEPVGDAAAAATGAAVEAVAPVTRAVA